MTATARGDVDRAVRRRAAIAGAIAAAVALAVGELVSAFGATEQSLVGGVANEVVDRAAGGLVRFAIRVFGTADKAVLVVLIVAVCLLLGAWLGGVALRRWWAGVVGFTAFGALGAAAGLRDPLASAGLTVVAASCAVAAGLATLRLLLSVARGGGPVLTATRIERPSDGNASRRAFFGWAGAAGAFAALGSVAARSLSGRHTVEEARRAVTLPTPSRPAPGEGAGLGARAVEGLTPYVTSNEDFYRIDTALLVPQVDPKDWTLSISGLVDRPLELTYDDLLAMADVEEVVTLACVSNEVGGDLVGNARWQGVPLVALLDRAGVQRDATQIIGVSVDGFTAGFPTAVARDGRAALVAVGMNGEPLPARHGFPARLVVSGLYGYVSATKWLDEIRLTRWEDVDGYWIRRGWAKEGPIETQSRIDVPRARARLAPGPVPIAGVAWAPSRGIAAVEVQVDDGEWQRATLGEVVSDHTWVQWVFEWQATPGEHRLRVRATDGAGETQTAQVSPPEPDGATGWHTRTVVVEDM